MADTGKIKEMKDREERCERAQKYVDELLEVHQRVATGVRRGSPGSRRRARAIRPPPKHRVVTGRARDRTRRVAAVEDAVAAVERVSRRDVRATRRSNSRPRARRRS